MHPTLQKLQVIRVIPLLPNQSRSLSTSFKLMTDKEDSIKESMKDSIRDNVPFGNEQSLSGTTFEMVEIAATMENIAGSGKRSKIDLSHFVWSAANPNISSADGSDIEKDNYTKLENNSQSSVEKFHESRPEPSYGLFKPEPKKERKIPT